MSKSALEIIEEESAKVFKRPGILLEWHAKAKLEATVNPFFFFRNGVWVGVIQGLSFEPEDTAYLSGMVVKSSFRGTGIGRAMIGFLFQKMPGLQNIELHNWRGSRQFYYAIGGRPIHGYRPGGEKIRITRSNFKPSPFQFNEVSWPEMKRRGFNKNDRMLSELY